jgi:DNA-binding PadR family transcriptional regulator
MALMENNKSKGKKNGRPCLLGRKHSPSIPILTLFIVWWLHEKPRHGYLLAKEINELSVMSHKPSTIYSFLAELEKEGLIESSIDDSGPHIRKIYKTTKKGLAMLHDFKKNRIKGVWKDFVRSLIS